MTRPESLPVDAAFTTFGELADYDYRDETITPGILVLTRRPDVIGETGERMEISHDVRGFEIRTPDLLKDPARGHRIIFCDQTTYEVQSPPHKDRLGLVWIIDAYLI